MLLRQLRQSLFDSDDDLSDHMARQLELESLLNTFRSQRITAMHVHSQAVLLAKGLQHRQVSATGAAVARQVHPEERVTAREEIHPEKALRVCEEPVHGTASQADVGASIVEQPRGLHSSLVVEVAVASIVRGHCVEYHVEGPVRCAD
jgi:hypothetical protein